ncbi:MAG: PAS domain S-box protein, partial [Rhodocyclaceae bacterium]|nr:PAS domain S-box protein [Rhodocyclaceae bacterium]
MPTPDSSQPPPARGGTLLAIFVAFSLAIATTGAFLYRALADDLMLDKNEELTAVATLKARQVEDWLAAQRKFVQARATGSFFIDAVKTWRTTRDPRVEQRLRARFETELRDPAFVGVEMLDLEGQKLLAVGSSEHDPAMLRPLIGEALAQPEPLLLDLHRHADGTIHMGLLAAVRDQTAPDQPPSAMLLYSINTEPGLLPLVRDWPRPSASGEIVLVRRDGDRVMHLTGVHHGQAAPLSLGVSMDQTHRPSIQALLHGAGIYAGPDYGETPVLLAARPVAGTPWILLAKVDRAEVTAGLRQLGAVALAMILLAIGAAGALIYSVWHRQQLQAARASQVTDLALRKLAQADEQSPESIVITGLDGTIEYINAAFSEVSGYAAEELQGQNPRILQSGKTPPTTYVAMWDALTQGQPWKGEFINRKKDGSEYVEFAIITPIRQSDGRISHYVAVKEDVT